MKKFIVRYYGYVVVEAADKDEALDKAQEDETIYEEREWESAYPMEDEDT